MISFPTDAMAIVRAVQQVELAFVGEYTLFADLSHIRHFSMCAEENTDGSGLWLHNHHLQDRNI